MARRGTEVINDGYPRHIAEAGTTPDRPRPAPREVRWPTGAATLQAIDVPALVYCAERATVVIELCVRPGQVIPSTVAWL